MDFLFIYLFIGSLLSGVYYFLAGGDMNTFVFGAVYTPLFLAGWLASAKYAGICDHLYRKESIWWEPWQPPIWIHWKTAFRKSNEFDAAWPVALFWVCTLFCFLPIIFHWSAKLLGKYGHATTASFLETHRFDCQGYVLGAAAAIAALVGAVWFLWRATRAGKELEARGNVG